MDEKITAQTSSGYFADQRKQYIIKPDFQYGLILESILATFIVLNTIVVLGYFLVEKSADIQVFREFLGYSIAAIELIAFGVIFYVHRRTSHRIAGPIYTLEHTLREIADGNLQARMKLRKTDHFQEMCSQVNTMVDTLEKPAARSQKLAREIQISSLQGKPVSQDTIDQLVDELAFFNAGNRD